MTAILNPAARVLSPERSQLIAKMCRSRGMVKAKPTGEILVAVSADILPVFKAQDRKVVSTIAEKTKVNDSIADDDKPVLGSQLQFDASEMPANENESHILLGKGEKVQLAREVAELRAREGRTMTLADAEMSDAISDTDGEAFEKELANVA